MAAFIQEFAKDRAAPDRAPDCRRDHWRSNDDRHPTGHGFHPHRQIPEITKHGAAGVVLRRPAVAAPVHRWVAEGFATALGFVGFGLATAIALMGLVAAIITPPI
jgi:hypothetical protein